VNQQRHSKALPLLATAAILLPLLYGIGYLSLLDPTLPDGTSSTVRFHPRYRCGGRAAELLFYPAQWIEERVFHKFRP
jgi:hypothetical protein